MSKTLKLTLVAAAIAGTTLLAGCASAPAPEHHPAYLHALSDLRAARWLVEHRTGDWAQSVDEVESVRQIDAAINDIKQAAIDDGKNLNDHPPVDERPDHRGRIHAAIDYMKKARGDLEHEEDNLGAKSPRFHAIGHIDEAIRAARRVFND